MPAKFINGVVTRVEVHALFVDTAEGPAYVLAPDVSTVAKQDLLSTFQVGQGVRLYLTRFVHQLGLHQGRMYEGERPT